MSSTSDKNNLNYNYIVGLIVMGVLLVICIAVIAILLCHHSTKKKKEAYPMDYPDSGTK